MQWTELDTWIVVTGMLSAMSCALPGAYLVLRRMSMMGDAISHAVLPGLAVAFLLTGSRASLPMLIGATAAADHVDLDPSCVLYGAIALTPLDVREVLGFEIPQAAVTNLGMLLANLGFVLLFFKELRITSFDPALATTIGINAKIMHYALMTLTAATTVAAFESVGSILVIAMLIIPPATAHLLTDRMSVLLILSLFIAALSAALGHLAAITVPTWFGFQDTSTAGMMAVTAGLIFALTFCLAPRYGLISRVLNQAILSLKITRDDIMGLLYRYQEVAPDGADPMTPAALRDALKLGPSVGLALWDLIRLNKISKSGAGYRLTASGLAESRDIVRSHRLWEAYLCDRMGYCAPNVHDSAHRLEHVTSARMQDDLMSAAGNPDRDPHDREIPERAPRDTGAR